MSPEHQRAHHHQRQLDEDEHAEFRIAPVYLQTAAAEQSEVQAVVTAGNQQEHGDDGVDGRTGVITDTGVVGRKAADGDGRETVADGIEHRHSCSPERQRTGYGQQHID